MPVTEYERVDALISKSEIDGCAVGRWGFSARNIDGVPSSSKGWNKFSERGVEIFWHRHKGKIVIDARIGKQNA